MLRCDYKTSQIIYFSATINISKSSVVSLSFLELSPKFCPEDIDFYEPERFPRATLSPLGT